MGFIERATQSRPNTVKQERVHNATPNRRGHKANTEHARAKDNDGIDVVHDSGGGGEGLDVKELLNNVEHEELLENKQRIR
jgi:hypothetical protein